MKLFPLLCLILVAALETSTAQTCDSLNTTAGTATISAETACSGDSIVMSITGYTSGQGTIIEWEESVDSITWSGIFGASNAVYSISSISAAGTHYYRAAVTCSPTTAVSNVVSVVVLEPLVTTTSGDTVCGSGTANLQATASTGATLNWFAEPTGGSVLASGPSFMPSVSSDTTFYVEATTGGGSATAPLPAEASTFTGNVRGYWFTAPISFTITGLKVPGTTVDQSIAVVKFVPAVPPPFYTSTTNDFVTLFLTQNNTNTGVISVNIQVNAGDVIGILGQRGTTTAYAPSPNTTIIDGNSVTITRMGMQNSLTNAAPQDLFQEPASSIGLIEMTYSVGCQSPRVAVAATVTPAPPVTITASATYVCESNSSVTLTAGSPNDPNYNYTWQPGGQSGNSITPLITSTTTFTVTADDGTCVNSESINITLAPPIISNIISSPSYFAAPNCNGTIAAYPTGGTPPFTISWNTGSTTNVCQGWYTATMTDANGCVKIDSVYVNFITGIEELNAVGISVYPNPANDVITINSDKMKMDEITIYDINGKLIKHEIINSNNTEVNVKEFKAGIYFIKINSFNVKFIKK